MNDVRSLVAENVGRVRAQIAAAAASAGRAADEVTLVAVTKYVEADVARALVAAGCHDLGESRPQSLWDKAAELATSDVRWHLIGHLQRNKIRRTLPLVSLIQSVDSRRLLAALDEEAGLIGMRASVLLEVNVTLDRTKTGLPVHELEPLVQWAATLAHVSVRGLMGMATLGGGDKEARLDFARLRNLRDQVAKNCPPNVVLGELSMGMSNDFEAAIREGATIVRVGSALVEGLEP
jgi:PLP dependent protein